MIKYSSRGMKGVNRMEVGMRGKYENSTASKTDMHTRDRKSHGLFMGRDMKSLNQILVEKLKGGRIYLNSGLEHT